MELLVVMSRTKKFVYFVVSLSIALTGLSGCGENVGKTNSSSTSVNSIKSLAAECGLKVVKDPVYSKYTMAIINGFKTFNDFNKTKLCLLKSNTSTANQDNISMFGVDDTEISFRYLNSDVVAFAQYNGDSKHSMLYRWSLPLINCGKNPDKVSCSNYIFIMTKEDLNKFNLDQLDRKK